uniref:Serine/threonine-protein phosphatase 2A activator n=1 Tax=Sexangularia sp. CB-2014 TaxID=1486929 RepID=A0A7S1YH10_9EUKA|mmetsp:Transcript_3362/g.11025  ORF Transcript_3362/g.11025 Transcript_3362/m.11025 type:complete len:430 (+) Transcript_3362:121-1410(+)
MNKPSVTILSSVDDKLGRKKVQDRERAVHKVNGSDESVSFASPARTIATAALLDTFLTSSTSPYPYIVTTMEMWAKDIEGIPIGTDDTPSPSLPPPPPAVHRLCLALHFLSSLLSLHPPLDSPTRYGNKAYRGWRSDVETVTPDVGVYLATGVVGESLATAGFAPTFAGPSADSPLPSWWQHARSELAAAPVPPAPASAADVSPIVDEAGLADAGRLELAAYLHDSLGSYTRIDYGTGHEFAFFALLVAMRRLGLIPDGAGAATLVYGFHTYIELMRRVQLRYLLEPAGSHGVWSLDDYQFLPFYFGASQLTNEEGTALTPDIVRDREAVDRLAPRYMYLSAIQHIHRLKTGPFAEHSPILHNISAVPRWSKVYSGMLKMWKAEVAGKFPVMQHFRTGGLLFFAEGERALAAREAAQATAAAATDSGTA